MIAVYLMCTTEKWEQEKYVQTLIVIKYRKHGASLCKSQPSQHVRGELEREKTVNNMFLYIILSLALLLMNKFGKQTFRS